MGSELIIASDLTAIDNYIKAAKKWENLKGYSSLILHSRLPQTIIVRRGIKKFTYKLSYGDIDDRVYISYVDGTNPKPWWLYKKTGRVLMHYEESTLEACITKAWRNLAENHIKVL